MHTDQIGVFTFIETWDSKEALEAHTKTDHYKIIVPILEEYVVKPVELDVYEIVSF